jgi:hypothetical protein
MDRIFVRILTESGGIHAGHDAGPWGDLAATGLEKRPALWADVDPQAGEWHSGLGLHPGDPSILYATGSRQGIYQVWDRTNSAGSLVSAGVYRYTTQLARRVYLPVVLKGHVP